ncbi:DUF3825 domain-containing protein [Vibrio viridaestus]|nr:DUF3825 domain-containing protein [Vibrio viridaestus]
MKLILLGVLSDIRVGQLGLYMYEDLLKRYRDEDPRSVFAYFGFRTDLGETWEAPFAKLADMAKPEDWNFSQEQYRKEYTQFPILISYLNFTFLRLQQQDKIKVTSDGTRACFNTGLQTRSGKDIFATFFRNNNASDNNQSDWKWYGFFDGYSAKMKDFEPLPDIATYIDDPSLLVFDYRYELEIDFNHILNDNRERLPEILQSNPVLARNAVEGAINQLKDKLRRNYKMAIPHWYDERIQLLLPLCITDDTQADVVVVAEKNSERRKYMVRTVLTMDMAYQNARVICAPDRQWLNP